MYLTSSAVENGVIDDKYGKRGTDFKGSMPIYSMPFDIHDAPHGTVAFAFILDDPDSVPVAGFTWVHWLGADLRETTVPEDASRHASFIQGRNSWGENLYGGMAPPNAPHVYQLHVYALDTLLNLKVGFTLNELKAAIDGHIMDQAVLKGRYDN